MNYKRKGKQERGSTREVKTRIPEAEYEEWKRRAEFAGLTVSEYIRRCVRGAEINVVIRNTVNIEPLSEIAAQYGKIGSNINQIAHFLNGGSDWSAQLLENMESVLSEMHLITKELSKVVGEINGYRKTQSNEKFRL